MAAEIDCDRLCSLENRKPERSYSVAFTTLHVAAQHSTAQNFSHREGNGNGKNSSALGAKGKSFNVFYPRSVYLE